MGKSAPSPPPAPDPNALISAQADANRITQFTPYGNLLFGSVGDQGQFVQGPVPEDDKLQPLRKKRRSKHRCVRPQKAQGWALAIWRLSE